MENSKFLTLFRTLSSSEVFLFKKYLKRIYSREQIALSIFNYLVKNYKKDDSTKRLQIEFAYKKIFGNLNTEMEKRHKKKIWNSLSDLYIWLKEFLIINKIRENSLENQLLWLNILKERGLMKVFSESVNHAQKKALNAKKKGVTDYIYEMLLNYQSYYYQSLDEQNRLNRIQTLDNCINTIDFSFSLIRRKMTCELINLNDLVNINQIPINSSQEFYESHHLTEKFSTAPIFLLYEKIYKLLTTRSKAQFYEIRTILDENLEDIPHEDIHIMISYLQNYIAQLVRSGALESIKDYHYLNKLGVKHGVFDKKGTISVTQFNNIINIAAVEKDFNWALNFIKDYSSFLPIQSREIGERIGKADIFFQQKRFDKSLAILKNLKVNDIVEEIRVRSLVLRNHVELNEDFEVIHNFINSFEAYLRRKKTNNPKIINAALNFLKLTKELINKKVSKKQLINKIKDSNSTFFRTWLLDKAGEAEYHK